MTIFKLIVFVISIWVNFVNAGHYKGGTITWKPVNPNATGSMVEILIYQSHSWTLSRLNCDQNTIDTLGWYNDGPTFYGEPNVACITSGTCTSSGFVDIIERTYCTDFSPAVSSSSGALIKKLFVSRTTNIIVGFAGYAWASVIQPSSGLYAGYWKVVTRIDLTQKFPFNYSPVTGSLPIIRVIEGRTAVIQIPAADWDRTDDVRCRWASSSGSSGDECADICGNLPGATISASECTMTWLAVRRPTDITSGIATSTYVAAIMVEDFVSTSSTTPMSSVPLQMLIYVYTPASGACSTVPAITGDRPNRACIGVPIGIPLSERIVATVYCSGDYIDEFLTISPLYMKKSAISQVPGTTNQWYITLTWTPIQDQEGPQVFCAAPIDQRGLTGSQHCINFVVGYTAPNLVTPVLVQGSASPLGTVFKNQSIFSIQATAAVYRPNRNGTYIQIYNRANPSTPEWQVDCGYSPDCIYTGQTVVFYVRNASWTYGANYYILFGSGAASGNIFCAPESAPISDTTYWNFNIWDPGQSSTTTTTTTPPTTVTVTTRGISTTTPMANLTTTGIVITTTTIITTTVTTTTTSTTTTVTTTSVTTSTQTTIIPEMTVISPKEYEELCKQPIAAMTATFSVGMAGVHALSMFLLMLRLNKIYNPNEVAAAVRRDAFNKVLR